MKYIKIELLHKITIQMYETNLTSFEKIKNVKNKITFQNNSPILSLL